MVLWERRDFIMMFYSFIAADLAAKALAKCDD